MDGTQGQTWQLFEVEGKLYCGHNEGTFLIDGSQTKNKFPYRWLVYRTLARFKW